MMVHNNISTIDSQVIHTLRFPLVVLVVIIHSFSFIKGWEVTQLDLSHLSGADVYSLFCISLSMTLAHIAVPTFFVISGYLFFIGLRQWNWQLYGSKIKKRVYTLLIPYMAWNSLRIAEVLSKKVGGVFLMGKPIQGIVEWWHGNNGIFMYYHADDFVERISWIGGEGLFSFPILTPMWYIRDLMVLCLLSPVVYGVLCQRRSIIRYVVMALIVVVYITAIYPYVPGLTPGPVLFFCFGALLSLEGTSLVKTVCRIRVPAAIVFFTLWIPLIPMAGYRTVEGNYLYPFFIMAGVSSIIGWTAWLIGLSESLPERKILVFFHRRESDVFFIFAAHFLLLSYVDSILLKAAAILTGSASARTIAFADQHPLLLITCYLLKIFIVILVCIALSQYINKHFKRVRHVLTGRTDC